MKLNAQGFISAVEESTGWKMCLSIFWKYLSHKLIKPAGYLNFYQWSNKRKVPYFTEKSVQSFLKKMAKLEKKNKVMVSKNGRVFVIFGEDKDKITYMKNTPDRIKLFTKWL